ncbi:hypothetical protein HDV01_002561 [Terramyces sp. JEL0728]|nr:hypothetical protein HDV01_002561 [Terramyces sp. JEL0728]
MAKDKWDDIRLPTWVSPSHYELYMETNLKEFTFEGKVHITVNVEKKTKFIVVHQVLKSVDFIDLVSADGSRVRFSHFEHKPEYEYSILHFKKKISKGEYVLSLGFYGELATNMAGYYLSTYKDGSADRYLATTQFEPTKARYAFPSFDEPEKKAVFDISMTTATQYHAISNMPVKDIIPAGDYQTFVFDSTVKMSTYLVAFIVSEFESISAKTNNGVKVSVYTPPGKTKLGEYALKVGVPILEYYQKVYGIDFPLPKLDMVAVPDFSAGAMENWGLVTYRDTALLYDPKASTPANKQRVATVIAHELAHQWFGNLVTMKWWNDLWLNEGFAEFMEYKAVQAAEPTWNMTDQFIPLDLVRALRADESQFTHSIALPVKDPAEISNIFDDISYGKGSSILRMLEAWMDEKYGKDVFFGKLHNYLTEHAYGNAETEQLWAALRTDQDVGAFMSTWTDQPGFPYLQFTKLGQKSVTVQQERFLFGNLIEEPLADSLVLPSSMRADAKKQRWSIPLSYSVYSNQTGKPIRLTRGFTEINELGKVIVTFDKEYPEGSVLFANFAQTGVYRSLYDARTYRYIIDWLEEDLEFSPAVERAGLISDIFAMTFTGRLADPTIALEILKILKKETSILVWDSALKEMENLKDIFALYPTYGPIVEFQSSLIENVLKIVGWTETSKDESEHHLKGMLRARLLGEAVRNNHKATVEKALEYFKLIKAGQAEKVPVSPDVFGAIYDAGIIYGDLSDYEFILEKYLTSTFAPDQQLYLHALAATKTPYLQGRTLALAISGAVRKQDMQLLISQVATLSPVGHITTWLFMMENWEKLTRVFNGGDFGKFSELLKNVVASFTKPYLISEAERLFVQQSDPKFYIPPGAKVAVLKGLETAKQLLAWRALYGEQVAQWLDAQ